MFPTRISTAVLLRSIITMASEKWHKVLNMVASKPEAGCKGGTSCGGASCLGRTAREFVGPWCCEVVLVASSLANGLWSEFCRDCLAD